MALSYKGSVVLEAGLSLTYLDDKIGENILKLIAPEMKNEI